MALSAAKRLLLLDNAATRPGQLTLANVINDANDSSGLLHLPGATWIGPAVTNLFSALVGAKFQWTDTCTRDSTDVPMIGGVSDKIVTGNVVLREGWNATTLTSVSANTTYTVSELVYAPNGATLTLQVDGFTSGDVYVESYNTDFVGTGAVQHVSVTFTTGATVVKLRPLVLTITSTQGITFYVGSGNSGLMGETGAVANPYTATSRSAGRVQMPWDAGLFTYLQGWMFACFRPGWNGAATPTNGRIATWGADATHVLDMYVPTNTGTLITASNSDNPGPITATHTLGTIESALMAWTPSAVFGGANGLALAGASRTVVNPITTSTIDIGSRSGITAARELAADFPVFVVGNGLVSNAAWAAMNSAFCGTGKPKPTIRALDNVARGAHAMAVWDGRTGTFQRRIGA